MRLRGGLWRNIEHFCLALLLLESPYTYKAYGDHEKVHLLFDIIVFSCLMFLLCNNQRAFIGLLVPKLGSFILGIFCALNLAMLTPLPRHM
jgi:hypothetical protein